MLSKAEERRTRAAAGRTRRSTEPPRRRACAGARGVCAGSHRAAVRAVGGGAKNPARGVGRPRFRRPDAARRANGRETRPGAPRLHVATVDHGLRPDSRAEAENVGEWAHRLGLCARHSDLERREAQDANSGARAGGALRTSVRARRAHRRGCRGERPSRRRSGRDDPVPPAARQRPRRPCRHGGVARPTGAASMHALCCSAAKTELVAYCAAKAHPFFSDPSNRDRSLRPHADARASASCSQRKGSTARGCCALGGAPRGPRRRSPPAPPPSPKACDPRANPASGAPIFRASAAEPEEIFLRVLGREIAALGASPDDQARPLRLERLEALAARPAPRAQRWARRSAARSAGPH